MVFVLNHRYYMEQWQSDLWNIQTSTLTFKRDHFQSHIKLPLTRKQDKTQATMYNIISTPTLVTSEENDNSTNSSNNNNSIKRKMSTVSLDSYDQQQQVEAKRVHFADDVSISASPAPLDRLESDITSYSELWYQVTDLTLFRDEARQLCRDMRRQDEQEPTYDKKLLCLSRHDEQTRGLEQRSCLERQRRKYLTSRFILKAFQEGKSPQKLAAISQRITAWAAELAVQEAKRDYVRAYQQKSTKRCRSENATIVEEERCVRPRLGIAQSAS